MPICFFCSQIICYHLYLKKNQYSTLRKIRQLFLIISFIMESAKGRFQFRFDQYDVIISPFSEKTLQITVIDPFDKIEFHEKLLALNNIGSTTLIKALEKKMMEVKLEMKTTKTAESAIFQIDILVASQFLRPVEETIYLKKSRNLSDSEILKNSVNKLTAKLKQTKQNDKLNKNIVICGTVQEDEKYYNVGNNMQQIAEIRLKKGKYMLNITFFAKAQNSLMYLYYQSGQKGQIIPNSAIYFPNGSSFIPFQIRKAYQVTQEQQNIIFQGYCTQSYPTTLKNLMLTAHRRD